MIAVCMKDLVPEHYPGKADDPQYGAQHQTGNYFPSYHRPPVCDGDLAQGHGLDDERGGLGAAVTTAGDDERNKEGQDDGLCYFILEVPHGRSGEHFTE